MSDACIMYTYKVYGLLGSADMCPRAVLVVERRRTWYAWYVR